MNAETRPAAASIRKAAVAAYEALPAILLAAALLLPALAAFALPAVAPADLDRTAVSLRTGLAIAEQGDRALVEIRENSRRSLKTGLALPALH